MSETPLDKLKKVAATKKSEKRESKEGESIFYSASDKKWADVAEPFKGLKREPTKEKSFTRAPYNRKSYDDQVLLLGNFIKSEKARHLKLKMSDTGQSHIVHQGSVNDIWARVDRNGKLTVYRTMFSRMLQKAKIIKQTKPVTHPGV